MGHFEVLDVDHIRSKFMNAEDFLVVKLGKAISRRRQYLRYRKEYRERLKQDIVIPQMDELDEIAPSIKPSSTLASSILAAPKNGSFSPITDETRCFEDGLS